MKRFFAVVILIPLAIIVVTLAVANRQLVTIALDPFNPGSPALGVSAPLFIVIFASIALGVLIGGVSDWMRQSYWRHEAREKRREARSWQSEASRLRERMDEPDTTRLPRPSY